MKYVTGIYDSRNNPLPVLQNVSFFRDDLFYCTISDGQVLRPKELADSHILGVCKERGVVLPHIAVEAAIFNHIGSIQTQSLQISPSYLDLIGLDTDMRILNGNSSVRLESTWESFDTVSQLMFYYAIGSTNPQPMTLYKALCSFCKRTGHCIMRYKELYLPLSPTMFTVINFKHSHRDSAFWTKMYLDALR